MKTSQSAFALFLCAFLHSFTAQSAALDAFCHTSADQTSAIQGKDVNELLPIASVSKVFTTHWSLVTLGPDYQFTTRIYLNPNTDGTWDLHLQGSRDPYFGKESFHFLISELNKMGITSIRNFSFDENFKTYWNVTSGAVAVGDYTWDSPTPETVLKIFDHFKPFLNDYSLTAERAANLGIQFSPNPKFQIQSFQHIPTSEFRATPQTQVRLLRSAPLSQLLKEMNRNSNNHAANQIFQKLGGYETYENFIQQRLKLTANQISFVNGSGAPLMFEGVKTYNKATCSSVLGVMSDMKKFLGTQNKNLSSVMALAGGDIDSTVNRRYLNSTTDHTVIAKTGTVNPAITLGGLVSTKKGNVFFFYNMKTAGNARDWNKARAQIKINLTNLINSVYAGGRPMGYEVVAFNPYNPQLGNDNGSVIGQRKYAQTEGPTSNFINSFVQPYEDDFNEVFEDSKAQPAPEPELLLGSFQ